MAGALTGATTHARASAASPSCRSRPLANGDLATVAYNRDTTPHNITINFGVANSSWAGKSASLYDLWQHQSLGVFTGSAVVSVEGHGVVAVRMTAA